MEQSVIKGFEFLLMTPAEAMQDYQQVQSVDVLNELILKVCTEAYSHDVTDAEFRRMIQKLLDKKADLIQERLPHVRIG